MHDTPLNRRHALACLPALLAIPAALAQGAQEPAKPDPAVRMKKGPPGSQEGFTMPFAIAACWADDFGALQDLRLRARLDCSIGFAAARQPADEDASCVFLLSAGAAVECVAQMAAASLAGWGIVYQGAAGTDDLFEMYVKLGQVRRPADAAALKSALGVFARPDPRGAFDPAWSPSPECLEKVRVAMIEQSLTAVMVKPEKREAFLKAIAALAKASPAMAAAIGPIELWKDGCTPFILGRGSDSNMQTAIMAGRLLQRAGLFAFQYEASVDARPLAPGKYEAAAASSAETGAAAKELAQLLEAPGFEPLALVRLGKLLKPQARTMPPAMRILEPSVGAPAPVADKPA